LSNLILSELNLKAPLFDFSLKQQTLFSLNDCDLSAPIDNLNTINTHAVNPDRYAISYFKKFLFLNSHQCFDTVLGTSEKA